MANDLQNRVDAVLKAFADLSEYSETTVAVVFASRVEDALEYGIKAKMRADLSSSLSDRLFKHYGPLTTFSGKIDIAHAFSVIGAESYSDLRAIKDIRNRFAHSKNVMRFDSPEIAPLLQKLSGWTAKAKRMELFMERCITRAAEFEPHEPR